MTNPVVPQHLLGDHRDPTWSDMSQYVVHFTKSPRVFAEILATGLLRASGPYGFAWARRVEGLKKRHLSVCFSEVPLDNIERLVRRRGSYGIAFTKEFIRSRQGARVWYLDQGSQQARSLGSYLHKVMDGEDLGHPIWNMTPFIDLVMPGKYEWDWEREWRVQGDLHFTLEDLAFVVTPEGVEELAALELYAHPKHDLIVSAAPQALAEYVEDLVQQFFQTFEDPVNSLPVDGGEYVWIVEEWDTVGAVSELFPELLESVFDELVEYLSGVSSQWVLSADVASIYD